MFSQMFDSGNADDYNNDNHHDNDVKAVVSCVIQSILQREENLILKLNHKETERSYYWELKRF